MYDVDKVDIRALFNSPGDARVSCDIALWDSLRRTGSVIVTGFPDADKVDARARLGLKVFDLPEAEKRRMTTRLVEPGNRNYYRGYWRRTPERKLQNDFYDVGPDDPHSNLDLPGMEILTERTPWPDLEPDADWIRTVRAHYEHLNGIAQALIRSLGRSSGFSEDAIRARFEGSHSTLRFLSYAAGATNPEAAPDGAVLSAGRHTDASGLSLLWQDTPGLQAEGQDGIFPDIPALPNAISVHVGDVMTGMTRGAVPSTPHRVLACEGARRSVGFFLEPALDAPITPADHDGPVRPQDTYAWLLLQTFARRPQWHGVIRDPAMA